MKETFAKYIKEIVLSLSIALSAIIARAIHMVIVVPLYEANKTEELALITSLSVGLFLVTLTYSIYLKFFKKKKPITENYTFNKTIGVYTHNKTGQYFCGTCMVDGVESPLITFEHSWFCQRKGCSREYPNPDKPRPKPQREVISRGVGSRVDRYKRW